MASGDKADMLARIKAVLPAGWFPDDAPILNGVLSGPAWMWAWLYDQIQYARQQARIATVTGPMLDMAAADYLGARLLQRAGQGDTPYRARVQAELLRPRNTRAAMRQAMLDLTGREPRIFEPQRPADTGGWGIACGYGGGTAMPDGAVFTTNRTGLATYFDASGFLQSVGAQVVRPRYVAGVYQGPITEPAAANQITGARCEGAVAGTPGTPPPGWQGIFPISGLASQIIGAGTSTDGIPYLDVRLFGTTNAAGSSLIRFSLPTATAALTGQTWAGSAFVALVAGSLPGSFASSVQIVEWTAGGAYVTQASGAVANPGNAALGRQRAGLVATLSGGATTAAVMLQLGFAMNNGTALDVTLRIGLPQMENSAAVTSPMLPAVGTPAVSSRAADAPYLVQSGGGWGSMMLPGQVFVDVFRNLTSGVPLVAGWGSNAGGYGIGAIQWASPDMVSGGITDADLLLALDGVKPAGSTVWTRISS